MTTADVNALAALLHETADRHHPFEQSAPPHDWWDWYAPYLAARQGGSTPDDAAAIAAAHVDEILRAAD